jgi:acyl-CoA thioester hydrolase
MQRSDFWHFTPFRVRYYEADAQGILFNATYLAFFDTCIVEYLRELPFDWVGERARNNTDFHVVRALVEYAAPVRYDEEIEIGTKIEKLGRSSITYKFAVFGKGESDVRSTGEVVWVNADQSTHKSVPLPEVMRERAMKKEKIAAPA